MTRSKKSAQASQNDDDHKEDTWKATLKARNLEELTSMSRRSQNSVNKRQKLMSQKSNDHENIQSGKDSKIFSSSTTVDDSTKPTVTKSEVNQEDNKNGDNTTSKETNKKDDNINNIQSDASMSDVDDDNSQLLIIPQSSNKILSIQSLEPSKPEISQDSNVSGLKTQETQDDIVDQDSDCSIKVIKVQQEIISPRKDDLDNLNIELNWMTDDLTICGWPSRALIQIIHKTNPHENAFPSELYTKCGSQLLRRIVIDIRNSLIEEKNTNSILTNIPKTNGIFTMYTKTWEILSYDTEDIKEILKQYLLQSDGEKLSDEFIMEMTQEEAQGLLFRFQDEMNNGDIEPINLHIVLPFCKTNVPEELNKVVQKVTLEYGNRDQNSEVNDKDDELQLVRLEKHTSLKKISSWSGSLLLSILSEWYELKREDFDEEYYQSIPSTQLRYHVMEVQQMLRNRDRINVTIRKRDMKIYSKATQDWEITAWDEEDLPKIYHHWCKCTKKRSGITTKHPEMFKQLIEMNEQMVAGNVPEVQFSIELNTDFTKCNQLLSIQSENKEQFQAGQQYATLSSKTHEHIICTWCNKSLITIAAKFMNKFKIATHLNLKKINPKILRRYLMYATKFMALSKSAIKIRSEVLNLGIFHPHIADWEIENMSKDDMVLILQTGTQSNEERDRELEESSEYELRELMKEFRSHTKEMGRLSGLRFHSAASSIQELKQITEQMYVKDKTNSLNYSMLCKFNLCVEENKEKEKKKNNKNITNNPVAESNSNPNTNSDTQSKEDITMTETIKEKVQEHPTSQERRTLFKKNINKLPIKKVRKTKTSNSTMAFVDSPKKKLSLGSRVITPRKKASTGSSPVQDKHDIYDPMLIDHTTQDWEIEGMEDDAVFYVYEDCLKKRGVQYDIEDVKKMKIEEIKELLYEARDQEQKIHDEFIKDSAMADQEPVDDIEENNEDELWNSNKNEVTNARTNLSKQKQRNIRTNFVNNQSIVKDTEKSGTKDRTTEQRQQQDQLVNNEKSPKKPNIGTNKEIETLKTPPVFIRTHSTTQGVAGEKNFAFKGLRHSAQNLLGVCANNLFVESKGKTLSNQGDSDTIDEATRTTFYIRVNLAMRKDTNHIPTLIKKFVRIIRQADPTIQVLPFNEQDSHDSLIITNEGNLPDTEDELEVWVAGIHTTKFNKLGFSLRVSNTMQFKELKGIIFDWCKNNGCYVKFDFMKTDSIFRVGWIPNIHPIYHNRDKLKDHLIRNFPHLGPKIHVYPRNIYIQNHDNTRTITEAIAIDGDYYARREIIKMLTTTSIDQIYPQAMFLPFRTDDDLTTAHHRKAMETHNTYLASMYTKVLNVTDPSQRITYEGTKNNTTFIQWLSCFQVSGHALFQAIEPYDNRVRIVYDKTNERTVAEIVMNLFFYIEDSFGQDAATRLLGDKEKYSKETETRKVQMSYSAACARKIGSLTTTSPEPPRMHRKTPTYYGKPPLSANKTNTNQSYASVTQNATSRQTDTSNATPPLDPDVVEKLQNTVNTLQTSIIMSEKNMESKLSKKFTDYINEKMENHKIKLSQEIESTKKELEQTMENTFNKITTMIDEKEKVVEFKITELANLIRGSQKQTNELADLRARQIQDDVQRANMKMLEEMRSLMTLSKPPSVVEHRSHRGELK